jgi:DNA mismatch repair protein MutS
MLPGLVPKQPDGGEIGPEVSALHPIVRELRDMNIDGLTPLEALTLLSKWKQDAYNA